MFEKTYAFSGFAVNDVSAAKQFYGETLGVTVEERGDMGLALKLGSGAEVFIYPKKGHQPATYTILNFVVDDIEDTVQQLVSKGVTFEHYDLGNGAKTDEMGIMRGKTAHMGPDIAWFKDPAGNVLSVIEN